ncbi:hypothetical protein U1Q18_024547 [Sarracenia purpurea var. burkii]
MSNERVERLASVGTPAAQVHDFSEGFFCLLRLLFPQFPRNHGCGRRREILGARHGSEVVLGVLVYRSYGVIPPTESLILECLHGSDARRRYPGSACRTHLFSLSFLFSQSLRLGFSDLMKHSESEWVCIYTGKKQTYNKTRGHTAHGSPEGSGFRSGI